MAKIDLHPDFKDFLELLNSLSIKYMVIGGYAVIHYGYGRVTDDLDVWVRVDPENAQLVSRALREFAGFPAAAVRPKMFLEPGKIFMFGKEPVRIDILTGPSGVQFDDAYARKNVVRWDGVKVALIGFDDLKSNKTASGRPKDIADLQNLPTEAIASIRPTKRKSK